MRLRASAGRARRSARQVAFACLLSLLTAMAAAEEVRILDSHGDAAQVRVDLVLGAERSIDAAYFIFNDDHAGLAGLYLLRQAAAAGVRVRLLVDAQWNKVSRPLIAHLVQQGVQVRFYHRCHLWNPRRWIRRMHDKLLVVDGEHLVAGGRNIEDPYFGLGSRRSYLDRDIYLRGEVAAAANRYFDELWRSRHVSDPPLARVSSARIAAAAVRIEEGAGYLQQTLLVDLHPERRTRPPTTTVPSARFLHDEVAPFRKRPGIRQDLVEILDAVQHTLLIETPYLVVTRGMMRSFQELLGRGVRIRVLTNSLATTDNLWPQAGYVGKRKQLVRSGIELWEYRGPESLHSKSAVLDDTTIIIGSYNLDPRSERLNTEIAVVVPSNTLAANLTESMERNLRHAWRIGDNGWPLGQRHRYPGVGFGKKVKLFLARLLLPCIRHQL